jgi:hypothetical protein
MKTIRTLLGVCLLIGAAVLRASAAVHYVNAANSLPAPPFDSWANAATNIQDAIDQTSAGDEVLVTNGIYAFGGRVMAGDLVNRVALTNAITVQSVNGPWVTTILGAGATNGAAAVRCAWLTNGASLVGFTLQAGATRSSGDLTLGTGGGVWCASSNALVANCVIVSNNAASVYGAGVYQGTFINCLVASNEGGPGSSAAYRVVLNNCTIISNAAYGVSSPLAMTNSIIYFNVWGNWTSVSGHAFANCCTTPSLPGTGNFTAPPGLFADGVHLGTNSPCLGAGVNTVAGTDLFGIRWADPPSVGCAEWNPAPVIFLGAPSYFPSANGVALSANVDGVPPFGYWWMKDGAIIQSNGHYSSADTATLSINNIRLDDRGAYQLVVSNSFGMATSSVSQVSIHCVAAANTTPVPPYLDWTTAATNIQDAVDVAMPGDVVLVTNGIYAFGGRAMGTSSATTNRVAIDKPLFVQSVNGPWVTSIQGGNVPNFRVGSVRCAWLTNGASLTGFTLRGGSTEYISESGGGVCCSSSNAYIVNCLIVSNSAAFHGGGAFQGTLWNCALIGNTNNLGGGAAYSYLNNCTVVANVGGGGVYNGGCTNCVIYYNSNNNAVAASGALSFCCTYPLPTGGAGNFTNAPQLFIDSVHLLTNSPCIGSGIGLAGFSTDIDGRTWLNPPSVGCSEAPTVPFITQPAVQFDGNPGFSLAAGVTGAGALGSWWLFNGTPVPGGEIVTGAQIVKLDVSAVSLANVGDYQLVVSNTFGTVTSAVTHVTIRCVDANGINPVAPYSTWSTAATNIQDAITASTAGDIVLVTNGLYATGGKSMDGVITNRVSVDKTILVESVNGPGNTFIQGAWDAVITNGPGAIRCVWLTNNAVISGFTIYGGATRAPAVGGPAVDGGGIMGPLVGPLAGTAVNCIIISNAAANYGGGACCVNLNRCLLATNVVTANANAGGGGAAFCNVVNSTVAANNVLGSPSGIAMCYGGGLYECGVTNCAIRGNTSVDSGGGAYGSTLVNCSVVGNQIRLNTWPEYGGGVANCTLANCIVFLNENHTLVPGATSNYYNSTFTYSCTAPLAAGVGNIVSDPLLLPDGIHLSANSPCIGAGSASVASGTDIDGQPWKNPPSMGCDEWVPAPSVIVQPAFQANLAPHEVICSPVIAGQAPFNFVWTKDGVPLQDDGHYSMTGTGSLAIMTFGPDDAGSYQVTVTNNFGAATSAVVSLVIHTVDAAGNNPVPPYATWAAAATNIQDAINLAAAGDIVLVTNGVYAKGGLVMTGDLMNRVALNKPLTVTSVNGAWTTVVQGARDQGSTNGPGAVRCAYIANGAVLNGFTIENGATRATGDASAGGPLESGGGIYCPSANGIAFNCVLTNNSAVYGGGIAGGVLNDSLVCGNQAHYSGGGAYGVDMNNCTVVNNFLWQYRYQGAGVIGGSIQNSIILYNYDFTANSSDNLPIAFLNFSHCCTSPSPPTGTSAANISADPQFLDLFHISSTSPCRGAGSSSYAMGTDLDGEAWTNPPSIGCDEVIPADLVGSLSVSITAVATNLLATHYTGFSGWIVGRAAWVAWNFGDGTTVTNAGASIIHAWTNSGDYPVTFTVYNNDNPGGVSASLMVHVDPLNPAQIQPSGMVAGGAVQFQFPGQTNATYTIQYCTNLAPPITWQSLQTIYFNQSSTVQFSDPVSTNSNAARYYRVLTQ